VPPSAVETAPPNGHRTGNNLLGFLLNVEPLRTERVATWYQGSHVLHTCCKCGYSCCLCHHIWSKLLHLRDGDHSVFWWQPERVHGCSTVKLPVSWLACLDSVLRRHFWVLCCSGGSSCGQALARTASCIEGNAAYQLHQMPRRTSTC